MISFLEFVLQENSAAHKYSCLMLDCNDLSSHVSDIHKLIDPEDVYGAEEGYGLETEAHITVLYGIHESDAATVKDHFELTPVEYVLTGLSLFENEKYDVLKCSVVSKDLVRLNKKAKELDYTSDFPNYQPHMTIAYLKSGTGKKYVDYDGSMFDRKLTSNKFIFSNKDGEKTHWKID